MGTEQMARDIATTTGVTGLFSIVVTIISIIFVWYILQEVKMDTFFKSPRSPKARMVQILIAVVLGHAFAGFILDYWSWSVMLRSFVE
ncbi:DUF1146 family protein [Paenibacillus radicis (ex Gao et al. 2016)]|uniref:DUF1146 domain-containing protein n=1 Tax=Paenibacillus radicis (ex Gao et al. 2016) TaxID=1737354 RepID=A0A917M8S5_9BACL|nr:DUF1146 domain-containing protein [Paenibacillus radicis (ex Gao et al. 2016)]GGG84880.1 hypothetical protein GCM10010918_48460 [Paenibacillus radicis (ex Gao et al. 2016)]